MIDENIRYNTGVFLPFFLKSYSSDGTLYLSREQGSLETHSSFQELPNFKTLCSIDKEKETHSRIKDDTYNYIVSLLSMAERNIENQQCYSKLLESFFMVNELTSNKKNNKEESIKALELQSIILEKMIECIKKEIVK